jgi:predicted TIM-barrel fold metal-dependent hydrolase
LGVRAIKVHPRLQEFGVQQLDRIVPIAEACAVARVPLVVCSFQGGPSLYVADILELCASLARACPQTTIVLAHAGGHRPMDVFLMLKAFPNLMTDLSFSPIYYAGSTVAVDLEFLVRRSSPRQLLFGSDFPEASMKASVETALALAERVGMTPADRESVFSTNAASLLRLES